MLNISPCTELHGLALLAPLARYLLAAGATVGLRVTSDAVARQQRRSSRLALTRALVAGALAVPFSHAVNASAVVTLTVTPL